MGYGLWQAWWRKFQKQQHTPHIATCGDKEDLRSQLASSIVADAGSQPRLGLRAQTCRLRVYDWGPSLAQAATLPGLGLTDRR